MAVTDGTEMVVVKDMGLVTNVFNERNLAGLQGHLAIGHTRYSTTGASTLAQRPAGVPHLSPGPLRQDAGDVRPRPQRQPDQHRGPGRRDGHAARDRHQRQRPDRRAGGRAISTPIPRTIWRTPSSPCCPSWRAPSRWCSSTIERLIGVRDPHGFRPLCLGKLDHGLGAGVGDARPWTSRRPLRPGAGARARCWSSTPTVPVRCGPGPRSASTPGCACSSSCTWPGPTAGCTARSCTAPGSAWASCWPSRPRSAADMVMGVPDSGLPAAEGYARRSGIPYGQGLVKNRYIGRTFIVPDQAQRAQGVRRKLNPLRDAIAGQRLVVVDDSIVRGTTTRAMVRMLREAGRGRGSPAHLLAAVPLAVLLRTRHRYPRRAHRRQPRGRRDPGLPRCRQPGLPQPGRPQGSDRRARRRLLRRLPHRATTRPRCL